MDIWMSWCKRTAKCRYCQEQVLAGTPMVKGKLWRKQEGSARTWTIYNYWHPQCWVTNGLLYLEQHPYSTTLHSHRHLQLNDEDKQQRLRLLRDHARIIYNLKEIILDPNEFLETNKVPQMITKLHTVTEAIKLFGGAPKGWEDF